MAQFSGKSLKGAVELVSAGAILVGLIFVGFELRQNTSALEADTMQGLLELSNQAFYEITSNPELAELIVRARRNLDDLDEGEYLQYRSYVWADWNIWEHLFYSYSSGTMNDKLWDSWDKSCYSLYCEHSSRLIWNEIEPYFGREFRAHIQNLSEEDCASVGL